MSLLYIAATVVAAATTTLVLILSHGLDNLPNIALARETPHIHWAHNVYFLFFLVYFPFSLFTFPFYYIHSCYFPVFVLFLMSTRILTCFSIHREELKKVEAAKRR